MVGAAPRLAALGDHPVAPSRSPSRSSTRASSSASTTFLLVQWLAPLASEAPELLVAGLFAWRLNTNAGLGHARLVEGEPVDAARRHAADRVRHRRWRARTACRSTPSSARSCSSPPRSRAFAVAVLASRSISVREALALFGLFLGQFVLGGVLPAGAPRWERIMRRDPVPRARRDRDRAAAPLPPSARRLRTPVANTCRRDDRMT